MIPIWGRKLMYLGSFIGTGAGCYVLFDDMMKLKKFEGSETIKKEEVNPEDKVYLVTGANTGIGEALTWELAAMKYKVFMLCRDVTKCEKTREKIVLDTQNKYVYCRPCDLNSLHSIKEFAESFKAMNLSGIDGLCNNAGVMNIRNKSKTKDGIEKQFGVNHVGHFYLTKLLEDHIRAKKGRVVFLLNLEYRLGEIDFSDINFDKKQYNSKEAFRQSQLANAILVQNYVKFYSDLKKELTVNGAYPGICNTQIKRHMSIDKSIFGSYITGPFMKLFGRGAGEGSQTPLKLLLDPSLDGVSGKLYSNLEESSFLSKVDNEDTSHRLFLMDEYWTRLKDKNELQLMNVAIKSD